MQTFPRIVLTSWKPCDCQFENTSLPGVLQQVNLKICILKGSGNYRTINLSSWHPAFFSPNLSNHYHCSSKHVILKMQLPSLSWSLLTPLPKLIFVETSRWLQHQCLDLNLRSFRTCMKNLISRHQSTCLRLIAFASNIMDVHCTAFTYHCNL